jgi:diketogulonate reductase-like aldo/keto reductase
MEYREFGKTGFKVSHIGMGTYYNESYKVLSPIFRGSLHEKRDALTKGWQLICQHDSLRKKSHLWNGWYDFRHRGGRHDKVAALKRGLELGINLIDTAEIYETEDTVAEAIEGQRRDDLFIATKVTENHLRYYEVLKAAEKSLKKLKLSYIDLYMIHWPNVRVPIKDTMKAMEKLVKDGKVRFIGVSNFSLEQMKIAEEALTNNSLVSNQIEYNLKNRKIEESLLPHCENNHVAIMAYSPIAGGALANPCETLKAVMEEISRNHCGKTPAQIALNWLVNKSKVIFPIPRASKPERINENVAAIGWSLDNEEIRKLEKASPTFLNTKYKYKTVRNTKKGEA